MSVFKDKTLMITGGTGSFGNAVLNGFLETDIKEIRIFSRDEKKQDDMRHEFQAKMPEASNKIKFFIGDVRDFYRVPCDKRDLNYDKYFKEGDVERNILTEFNSSNTELLDVEQVKEKLLTLQYIRDELAEWENR